MAGFFKKIFLLVVTTVFFLIIFLVYFGYETSKFNDLIIRKANEVNRDTKLEF